MRIPQFKPYIGKSEYQEIKEAFDKCWVSEGRKSKIFKEKLLKLTEAKYGVLAPNGTLGLFLSLKALGIGYKDEVLVPNFTFIASSNSVIMAGATPVFVDVNNDDFQINLTKADYLISKKTKAIMPVHIYGNSANMGLIKKFAKKYNLKIIEDAAQALGIKHRGKHVGTYGDCGVFSFYADKTITTGEGGIIVTNNKSLYKKLLYLRNHGRIKSGTFVHPEIGFNFRMNDIQASVGIAQLKKFNLIKRKKRQILRMYKKGLKSTKEISFLPTIEKNSYIPFRVSIIAKNAHNLMKVMQSKGIQVRTFFYPLHRQPSYKDIRVKQVPSKNLCNCGFLKYCYFPGSCYGYAHGVCLPTYAKLSQKKISYICQVIRSFYSK